LTLADSGGKLALFDDFVLFGVRDNDDDVTAE
jgi:hypothetical protein